MSSKKKAKAKKVSQNDLRKMMNDMKNKRTNETPNITKEGRTLSSNPDAYKKALNDKMKLKALIGEENGGIPQKKELIKDGADVKTSLSHKKESSKSFKRHHSTKTQISNMTVEIEKGPDSKMAKIDSSKDEKDKNPSGLLVGNYSSDSEEEVEPKKAVEDVENMETDESKQQDSNLPAGFFDDPEVDARMRGVETPAHVMDREWEEFQREIKRETGQSEQIVEEEQEVGKVDREIEEIDEQIMHFSKVERLNVARDEVKMKIKPEKMEVKKESSESDEDSGSEDIEEDLLDWREKDSHF